MTSIRSRGRPASANATGPDIRARLLLSARELLAEGGLSDFKVLEVAARAQANVAMINYHFGSRDGLLDEVIRLEGISIADERAKRLARLLDAKRTAPVTAEQVLRCWLEPMFENVAISNNREVMMLMVHLMFAADVSRDRKTHLLEEVLVVTSQYIDVLAQCLPDVPRHLLAWRMLCAVGASYVALGQQEPVGLKQLASANPRATLLPARQRLEETLAFIVAGMSSRTAASERPAPRKRRAAV